MLTGLTASGLFFVTMSGLCEQDSYCKRRMIQGTFNKQITFITKDMNTLQAKHIYRFTDHLVNWGIIATGIILSIIVPSLSGLGVCIVLTGLCILPFYKTGYRLPDKKGIFSHKDYILPQECKAEIAAYIEDKSQTLEINPVRQGGMLLEIYHSKKHPVMYAQLFDYSSGICQAQCELSEIKEDKLNTLLKYNLKISSL